MIMFACVRYYENGLEIPGIKEKIRGEQLLGRKLFCTVLNILQNFIVHIAVMHILIYKKFSI